MKMRPEVKHQTKISLKSVVMRLQMLISRPRKKTKEKTNFQAENQYFHTQSGQALVPLLIFVVVGMIIISFTVSLVTVDSQNASRYLLGEQALSVADSGIENAMMRLLRDPEYSGETISIGSGQAIITVSGSDPYTVVSIGSVGNFSRTVQVETSRVDGVLQIDSWQEIP